MADPPNWTFPVNLQPDPEETDFDLDEALDAVVLLRVEVPEDAFTAGILGTERVGNGVVIRDDGLVLTIGYLITEAESVWLTANDGGVVAGHPLAYDPATGFGLVLPLGRLRAPAIARGPATSIGVGDDAIVIGHGRRSRSLKVKIVAKREFAGYWEYVLDEAIFTAPAHPHWGGTALVGSDGRMVGLGSLLVQEARLEGESLQGNMFVPTELLDPILEDMLRIGRPAGPARPWLGIYAVEVDGHVAVSGVANHGPAAHAGIRKGDLVLDVAGEPVAGVADLFRKLWRVGPAGVDIALTLLRGAQTTRVSVHSADRDDLLRKPRLH